MSFGETLRRAMLEDGFGSERHVETFKFTERPHISKSKVDQYSDAVHLRTAESNALRFAGEAGPRYVEAEVVTYDLLLSLYEINSRTLIVYRSYAISDKQVGEMAKALASLKGRHSRIEARLIGLQNGQDYKMLASINDMLMRGGAELVEADLFGQDIRHVLFDAKLGTSFNVLLEDRVYRPAELRNQMTADQYERELKEGGATAK